MSSNLLSHLLVHRESGATTLVDVLRWQAAQQPENNAFTFLAFRDEKDVSCTYAELDQQARSIGAMLQEMDATGQPMLLLYPSGIDYIAAFFGCLYAGAAAIPAYPPHSARYVARIQAIIKDAQVRVVLTNTQVRHQIERWFAGVPELMDLQWVTTDDLSPEYAARWQQPKIAGSSQAFLQYTSGSTSTPKGVMVSHENLMHNAAFLRELLQPDANSVNVSWLPIYHDLGLIAGILQPVYSGFPGVLMSPASFLQAPPRWLKALSDYRGTYTYAPNFAFELCIRRTTEADRAQLDLSHCRWILNGAEPVRYDTLIHFADAFAVSGFRPEALRPAYGLAEATLIVSCGELGTPYLIKHIDKEALEQHRFCEAQADAQAQPIVGCGIAGEEVTIAIVHPERLTRCEQDEVGEIWVAGPSITQGYLYKPEVSKQTFQAYTSDTGEGPFLRTGDLGILKDGELYITGRLKDLIIINGRNHYPHDIELSIERSHIALRPGCSIAFSTEIEQEERLVVVAEINQRYHPPAGEQLDETTIKKAIQNAIVEQHDVRASQIVLLKTGGIPKTSSGKLQRRGCRAAYLEGTLDIWQSPISSS
jgi:acyl-CoA synthetase (AMP-forming)/AMP-acid ligase II